MAKNKRIRLFAGPNGSGKSTLFNEFSKAHKDKTGFFVNADKLEKELAEKGLIDLKEIGVDATQEDLEEFKRLPEARSLLEKAESAGHIIDVSIKENCIVDKSDGSHSYEGAFIASFIRWLLIRNGKNFSFETVMSHPSKVKEVQGAINKGYSLYLYFVCIDSADVNMSRVEDRVKKGGHNVDPQKIEDRYFRTLDMLNTVLPLCYRAYLFDNSKLDEMILVAELHNNAMELKTDAPPQWFIKYVLPYYSA